MSTSDLEQFVDSVCDESHLRIEDDLGDGFVRLRTSEAERRQAAHDIRSTEDIVIELLRNARDAHARTIFLAVGRDGDVRKLTMIDDGDGIPPALHERIFEPRVTSKLDTVHMDKWGVHGRGMALYSIKVNSMQAKVLTSNKDLGSAFYVETDLTKLPERADQSTFPTFEATETGGYSMRGPKNIVRTATEFALESRKSCTVYWGSATEIAATLYEFGAATTSPAVRAFTKDPNELAVCKRLCTASDPASFAEIAEELGLSLSERSARRILNEEIKPIVSLAEMVRTQALPAKEKNPEPATKTSPKAISHDARSLRLCNDDKALLSKSCEQAFLDIADRYYLEPLGAPEVKVGSQKIEITIRFDKQR
ncbi:ATP-binding protein [uncultured Ellagibacter sp.]|uniref:ATP-binding protein n=1 Tax=uncultured Ellagibacter sp. TaxID=2137580 RepID=UPI00261E438E|nr:ATP-binding protein [uncultured Ellagibacter sp.]